MCGRYRLSRTERYYLEKFGVSVEDFNPRFNISPSQSVHAVVSHDGERKLTQQRWGLIPFWAKDPKIGYKMINARSETIFEKPAFRDAFKKRRCLIPADGFYEWKKEGKAKQPFHFGMKDDSVFAFAGIWEHWKAPTGETVESCSILTTTPNELVTDIHDRMPVILPAAQYELWLTAEPARAEQLLDLLVPYAADGMRRYPVSSLVNSPKNDLAECAKAVSA